jgi:hypothetical protein
MAGALDPLGEQRHLSYRHILDGEPSAQLRRQNGPHLRGGVDETFASLVKTRARR